MPKIPSHEVISETVSESFPKTKDYQGEGVIEVFIGLDQVSGHPDPSYYPKKVTITLPFIINIIQGTKEIEFLRFQIFNNTQNREYDGQFSDLTFLILHHFGGKLKIKI